MLINTIAPSGIRPVLALMRLDVAGCHEVIRVLRRLGRQVDDNAGTDQLIYWQPVHRQRALGKVNGGIDVRASMLRRCEVEGAVVIAALRATGEDRLLLEHLGRRPVDGLGVEGVGEVDPLFRGGVPGLCGGGEGVAKRNREERPANPRARTLYHELSYPGRTALKTPSFLPP